MRIVIKHYIFHKNIADFQAVVKNDIIKNNYCNIPGNPTLLRISYVDFNKIEKILSEQLKT